MDPLSDILSLLRVETVLSGRLEARGDWALQFSGHQHILFGGALEGAFWLSVEGETKPIKIETGDSYLLTNGLPYRLASNLDVTPQNGHDIIMSYGEDRIARLGQVGPKTVLAGGAFTFDRDSSDILLKLLPPLVHIPAAAKRSVGSLQTILDAIGFEAETERPGSSVVASSLANIILVRILRTHLASSSQSNGWLKATADPRIGKALSLLHGDPARRWKVEDLAHDVGMSRTAFAGRFKEFVGLPPLDYLIRWRMELARIALKDSDKSLSAIAESVGYASDSAFNTAFKRATGYSPGWYREQRNDPLQGRGYDHPDQPMIADVARNEETA